MNDYLKEKDILLAHVDGKREESLQKHYLNTKSVLQRINRYKYTDKAVNNILDTVTLGKDRCSLSRCCKNYIISVFNEAVYMHDIGKINPAYQRKIGNESMESIKINSNMNSFHAELSSLLYIDIQMDILKKDITLVNEREKDFAAYLLFVFAGVIASHHGGLISLSDYLKSLDSNTIDKYNSYEYLMFYKKRKLDMSNFNTSWIGFIQDEINEPIKIYILSKLLFSLLISSDSYSTYMFMNEKDVGELDFGLIDNPRLWTDIFNKNEICREMKEYNDGNISIYKDKPINKIRREIYMESQDTLLKNLDKNIFNASAPTGSGKTILSVNIGLHISLNCGQNKLFYFSPFNSITEQTMDAVNSFFSNKIDAVSINSITPIKEKIKTNGEVDYDTTLADYEMTNYPVVLSSNVNFFNWLFGTSRQSAASLFQLSNSIVVLDEIHSYRCSLWREIIEMLIEYSKIFEFKLIIMSATLPNLENLVMKEKKNFVELLPNSEEYFNLLKDRVQIDFSLLNEKQMNLDSLLLKMMKEIESIRAKRKKGNLNTQIKTIVEFISKSSARKFYNKLKEIYDKDFIIIEITGSDSSYYRQIAIDILKNEKNRDIILVCTQAIEAGIDIDMDLGFKDYSLVESEEQFLGRINRSNSKEYCKAFFFSMDNLKRIYRNDVRTNFSILQKECRDILNNKKFKHYYSMVLDRLKAINNEFSKNGIHNFHRMVRKLEYENIQKHMKLIDDDTSMVFIPYIIKDCKGNEIYNGFEIWKEIKAINDRFTSYAEKKIKIKKYADKMDIFTYNIRFNFERSNLEKIDGIYYLPQGERFINEGKLDEEGLNEYLLQNF